MMTWQSSVSRLVRWIAVILCASLWSVTGQASVGDASADAITELDVARARQLIDQQSSSSPGLQFQQARLAVYVSDFDTAQAVLRTLPSSPAVSSLADLAQSCARATAGGSVIEDKALGIWMRLQDEADRPLAPRLFEVAAQARDAIARDLGVEVPRPLRIELVGDLFSLSAVSGLPLEAAETTGTVAVARWGRVTMLSPRAAPQGYPWEDTMAHEITHLGLTRATRDFAPLWLQEGVAKLGEERWRSARAFDERSHVDEIARNALITGSSVGVDALGPSIAMLPSADAASIAFAEVKSFMAFFIGKVGRPAFQLLLADLKGIGQKDPDYALRSVTGFGLQYWIAVWQAWLMSSPQQAPAQATTEHAAAQAKAQPALPLEDFLGMGRRARLGELFSEAERFRLAAQNFEIALRYQPDHPALRFEAARSWLLAGDDAKAQAALGSIQDISDLHGGWLALHGRSLAQRGEGSAAAEAFDLAMAVDPFAAEVACEGQLRRTRTERVKKLPSNAVRREICASLNGVD
jgi:tetratricopeptide (TPR) repeat protein